MNFKKIIIITLLFISCGKDKEDEIESVACFEIDKPILEVGQIATIINCSTNAISYEFKFGDGSTSNERNPNISYDFPGEYTVSLTIKTQDGQKSTTSMKVNVNPIEDNYIHPPVLSGDFISPTDFGIIDGKFYYIENYWNVISMLPRSYKYVEINESFQTTKTHLHEIKYNSAHTSLSLLTNGKKILHTVQSMSDRIGSSEILLNSNWEKETASYSSSKPIYGSISVGADIIYFGSKWVSDDQNENFTYFRRPYIEVRDNIGQEKYFKVFNEIEQGFIGDLISTENGYMAFGGTSTVTGIDTFTDYKPMIIFLDSNFDFINYISYETKLNISDNYNNLNGTFHIKKLSNNNFVLYSHDEFRIIDSKGHELIMDSFSNGFYKQGIICLEEGGFILSTKNFLKKYDTNGILQKSLRFNGASTPELIRKGNQIYFASAYPSSYPTADGDLAAYKIFIGSVDLNLNVINLN